METEEEDILLGDPHTGIRDQYKEYARAKAGNTVGFTAVSYTHLTLPTIPLE